MPEAKLVDIAVGDFVLLESATFRDTLAVGEVVRVMAKFAEIRKVRAKPLREDDDPDKPHRRDRAHIRAVIGRDSERAVFVLKEIDWLRQQRDTAIAEANQDYARVALKLARGEI